MRWFVSYLLVLFFLFFLFFCNQIVIMFKGTKDSCSASYGDKKPILSLGPFSFFFFCNQIVIMFKVQKTHAALAMEIKNL